MIIVMQQVPYFVDWSNYVKKQRVVKSQSFLYADTEDCDQIVQMYRLI